MHGHGLIGALLGRGVELGGVGHPVRRCVRRRRHDVEVPPGPGAGAAAGAAVRFGLPIFTARPTFAPPPMWVTGPAWPAGR